MKFEAEVEQVLDELRRNMQAQSLARPAAQTTLAPQVEAQLESHLTVTERAWSRLPPLLSHRQGWKARLELWCKRQIKRATWWYVWEQINFNAATNDALHLMTAALAQHRKQEAELRELRVQLDEVKASLQSLRSKQATAPEPVTTLFDPSRREDDPVG